LAGFGFSPSANLQLQQLGEEFLLSFSGHFVVTVPFSTPQAARRLLAVYPNMSELLAVIALREACAGPLCFHFYDYVVQVCELEKLLRFFVPL